MAASNPDFGTRELSAVGLFPLPNVVLFPGQRLSLHVFEPRYRRLVADAIGNDLMLAIPRLRPGHDADYYGAPPVFEVCGIGKVSEYVRLPDGRYNIVVQGLARVRLVEELRSQAYRLARAERLPDFEIKDPITVEALRAELSRVLRRAAQHTPALSELGQRMAQTPEAGSAADIVAGALVEDPDERQNLLEERDPERRLSWLIAHVHALGSRGAPSSTRGPETLN